MIQFSRVRRRVGVRVRYRIRLTVKIKVSFTARGEVKVKLRGFFTGSNSVSEGGFEKFVLMHPNNC